MKRGAQNLADQLSVDPAYGHSAGHAALHPSTHTAPGSGQPQLASDVLAGGAGQVQPAHVHEQTPLNAPPPAAAPAKKSWFSKR